MSDATVQTQREGKVLTVTQQLIPQVRSCRRGGKHLVRKEERRGGNKRRGEERKGGKRSGKKETWREERR